jgi:hypothetical protein
MARVDRAARVAKGQRGAAIECSRAIGGPLFRPTTSASSAATISKMPVKPLRPPPPIGVCKPYSISLISMPFGTIATVGTPCYPLPTDTLPDDIKMISMACRGMWEGPKAVQGHARRQVWHAQLHAARHPVVGIGSSFVRRRRPSPILRFQKLSSVARALPGAWSPTGYPLALLQS